MKKVPRYGTVAQKVKTLPMLPIAKHRKKIVKHIEKNAITVLSADTGSGKSTQIPQFLITQTPRSFVLVTQPRRIAAISLAKRVAAEVGDDRVGCTVGYAIGDDSLVDWERCRILFVTIGWLLLKIIHSPDFFFQRCTHVLLDDVHERTLEGDTLFLVIRQYLRDAQDGNVPKLVLMSATMEVDLICKYFSSYQTPIIFPLNLSDQKTCFPVQRLFLGKIAPSFPSSPKLFQHENAAVKLFDAFSAPTEDPYPANGRIFDGLWRLVEALLIGLLQKHTTSSLGILIFLPGVTWIDELYCRIELELKRKLFPSINLLAFHGTQDTQDHDRILAIKSNQTTIILATNVAESSLTIPNLQYVIDYGLHRTTYYSSKTRRSCLMTTWVSQSNLDQRSGRTGRTCPGFHICLFPESLARRLDDFSPSEMRRVSLAATILSLKGLSKAIPSTSLLRDPHAALLAAIDPPDLSHLDAATTELFDRRILVEDGPCSSSSTCPPMLSTAKMTSFGAICHVLPLHFDLTRLIVFGARSGPFIVHAVVMAVYIGHESVFPGLSHQPTDLYAFYRTLEVTLLGRQNADGHDYSDVIAGLRIFRMACTERLERYSFKQLHFTRVRTFCQSVSEISIHLMQHLPHHVRYLKALHQLASMHDVASLQTCDTIIPLGPTDIKYCKFMLAQVFIPIHEIMRGSPTKSTPPHSITIYVPEDQCHTLKTDLSHVFDAVLPFINRISTKGEPVSLPKPLPRAAASSAAILYRSIEMKFTHLDAPPSPFSFVPLPLRIFDIASTYGPREFLRFPFYSLDGGMPGLVEPGLLWLEKKRGGLTTSWSLGNRKCELEPVSILTYLTSTETPIFAVCAAMLSVVNRRKEVFHCQKITVLNNDPLLFTLIMLTLYRNYAGEEGFYAVKARGHLFPFEGTVSPLFFSNQVWQYYLSKFEDDWLDSADHYRPIDTFNPQFLEKVLYNLSVHFTPSSARSQSATPSTLSPEQEKTLFLAICRICSTSNNQSASLKKIVRHLGSHFGTTHPLCQNTTVLCETIRNMEVPILKLLFPKVLLIARDLPDRYQWQVSKTDLELGLIESQFQKEPQPVPTSSSSQHPSSSSSTSESSTDTYSIIRASYKDLKRDSPDLVSLQMDSVKLRQKDIQRLMKALKGNSYLKHLSLRDCAICTTESIGNMLGKNKILHHLDLSGNNLAKATAFYQALSTNTSLKVLTLQSARLGIEEIKALGSALGTNCTLTSLDLSSNQLESNGAKQMLRSFQKNTGLTTLTLNDNALGDAGAKSIGRLVAMLPALTSLALESNQIQKSGSRELLKVVAAHSSLRSLAISNNEIPDNLISLMEAKLSLRCEAVIS